MIGCDGHRDAAAAGPVIPPTLAARPHRQVDARRRGRPHRGLRPHPLGAADAALGPRPHRSPSRVVVASPTRSPRPATSRRRRSRSPPRTQNDLHGSASGEHLPSIKLANPLDGQSPFLRRSLVPGLLQVAHRNVVARPHRPRALRDRHRSSSRSRASRYGTDVRAAAGGAAGCRDPRRAGRVDPAAAPPCRGAAHRQSSSPKQPGRAAVGGRTSPTRSTRCARSPRPPASTIDVAQARARRAAPGTHRRAVGAAATEVGYVGELLPAVAAGSRSSRSRRRRRARPRPACCRSRASKRRRRIAVGLSRPRRRTSRSCSAPTCPPADVRAALVEGAGALLESLRLVDDYRGAGRARGCEEPHVRAAVPRPRSHADRRRGDRGEARRRRRRGRALRRDAARVVRSRRAVDKPLSGRHHPIGGVPCGKWFVSAAADGGTGCREPRHLVGWGHDRRPDPGRHGLAERAGRARVDGCRCRGHVSRPRRAPGAGRVPQLSSPTATEPERTTPSPIATGTRSSRSRRSPAVAAAVDALAGARGTGRTSRPSRCTPTNDEAGRDESARSAEPAAAGRRVRLLRARRRRPRRPSGALSATAPRSCGPADRRARRPHRPIRLLGRPVRARRRTSLSSPPRLRGPDGAGHRRRRSRRLHRRRGPGALGTARRTRSATRAARELLCARRARSAGHTGDDRRGRRRVARASTTVRALDGAALAARSGCRATCPGFGRGPTPPTAPRGGRIRGIARHARAHARRRAGAGTRPRRGASGLTRDEELALLAEHRHDLSEPVRADASCRRDLQTAPDGGYRRPMPSAAPVSATLAPSVAPARRRLDGRRL